MDEFNNSNVKKGNGLIVFLVTVVMCLTILSVLLFTGVIKSPFVKCDEKEVVENNTNKESTTIDNTKNDSNTVTIQKTSEERYREYLTNLANNIKTKYDEKLFEYDYLFSKTGIILNNNLELVVSKDDGQKEKIADNVVIFRVLKYGGSMYPDTDGEMTDIFYVTTEGKVYIKHYIPGSTNFSTTSELDYKNIIDIRKGSLLGLEPIFIDIDGNVVSTTDNSGMLKYKK